MSHIARILCLLAVFTMLGSVPKASAQSTIVATPGPAATAAANAPTAGLDPVALDLMLAANRAIKALPSAYVESLTTMSVALQGRAVNSNSTLRLWKSGPAKFYLMLQADKLNAAVVSDGQQVLTYIPMLKQYTLKPFSANTNQLIAPELASTFPMISLMFSFDSDDEIRRGAQGFRFSGAETVNGLPAKKLTTTTGPLTIDVWLTSSGEPLPVRMLIAGPTGQANVRIESDAKWVLQPVPDSHFQVQVPAGASKVEQFSAANMAPPAGGQAPRGGAGASAPAEGGVRVGAMAPDFTLPMADGREFRLSALRGQRVVVLDFFATWCGPCRASMPGVEAAAAKFPGQVELYAVNQKETLAKVQGFLQQINLKPRLLFDGRGEVGDAYGASSIPFLVVIDKQGVVQAVQRGLPRDSTALVENLIRKAVAVQ